MFSEEVLKTAVLAWGLALTIIVPILLRDRTNEIAVKDQLFSKNDENSKHTLDLLLKWRDLIGGFITGVFVLQFAAAEKMTSTNPVIAFIAWVFVIGGGASMFVLGAWVLVNRLKTAHLQETRRFVLYFGLLIVSLYLIALIFVWVS